MSAEKKALVCQLAEADRAARAHPHVDINSPVELCQASQPEIFVVPVRYALAEEWASHPCCDPGVVPQSHAMAARRLRCGYLYLWHHEGPLKRYAVADNGLLLEQGLHDAPGRVANGTLGEIPYEKTQIGSIVTSLRKGDVFDVLHGIFFITVFGTWLAEKAQNLKLSAPPDLPYPEISEWSKPLPPEQWAKRSPELEAAIAEREAELAAKSASASSRERHE